MGNRGQKRAETGDELPADKRACSSLDRPSSSNSSVQTPMNSRNSVGDNDADTSSSSSGSASENEGEKDSAYGSCDSSINFRDYQRRRSFVDHSKLRRVLSSLSEEGDESGQLAALTELCELLSFCTDSSLSGLNADSLSPTLVKLARHDSNPDIMLLAIRAITYLCDVHPRSSGYLVRHDAVPALCQRLMSIEYLDVAEQCLQALEKISREQPPACLQSGAIMAVLSYIDFFSTSVQRVALSTVVNICKKLPSEGPSPFMEAVPILCNLLQYEDRQLVEDVATCLIMIAERVDHSSDMLDELCKHGLIHQATHLIGLNSRTTICQSIYTGLIGLLVKLASGSNVAARTLFELNISSTLKDILSTYGLSNGMPSPRMVEGHCNQVHEVLKLLNELLPAIARDQNTQLASNKEAFLVNRPDLLDKFGADLLPVLIQVVNSGVNLYVCYGCLSVINKLVYFSKSDLLSSINISSFLAGVFTRKEHHVLVVGLQIVDTLLQKFSDALLNPFVKEGVFFAIDALLLQEKCSPFMFPLVNGTNLSNVSSQKSSGRDILRCLCYSFDTSQSSWASESGTCKLERDSVPNLAKQIKNSYVATDLINPERGLTDILLKLKTLSATLTDLVSISMKNDASVQHEEEFYCTLHQIMSLLNGRDHISTFEFVESGVVKSLVNFLYNGRYLRGERVINDIVQRRFEVFGRLLFSSSDPPVEVFPLSALVQRLQSALSSVENFPVILSHSFKQKNSYATVPHGRCMGHPCLKVQFVRGEGETCLSDYSEDVVTIDPFSSLDSIEKYLLPKVSSNKTGCRKSSTQPLSGKEGPHSRLSSDASSAQGKNTDLVDSNSMSSDVHEMQADMPNLAESPSAEAASLGHTAVESTGLSEVKTDPVDQERHTSYSEDSGKRPEYPLSCSNKDALPNLLFYLEEQQLDGELTLYQALLQQQIKAENELFTSAKLWSQVYKISYRRAVKPKQSCFKCCCHQALCSCILEKAGAFLHHTPFFSAMFASELVLDVETPSPTYDIILLLKSLEGMNRFRFHLMARDRTSAFAEGRIGNLDNIMIAVSDVLQNEFVSCKLTEKLEQQMQDHLAVSIGGMPSWCTQLMASCPFLFGFEARTKYFRLAALGQRQVHPHPSSHNNLGGPSSRQQNNGGFPRKKFLVYRNRILDSATQMMDTYARQKVFLEVEYDDEVGTGVGPTLEFYTLVSHEFQRSGLGMWREDNMSFSYMKSLQAEDSGSVVSPFGLFPCPWSPAVKTSGGIEFSEVIKKFVLLGQVVAKALQDGRVLDLPFSKGFYKLILGQELTVHDIPLFDPGLGRALLEFQALVERNRYLDSIRGEESTFKLDSCFRNTRIEDLCLDFTLPGYPDYVLSSEPDLRMVNIINLEEYISLVVDATINSGISRQVEAFKSGFNQVMPIRHLQIFTEENWSVYYVEKGNFGIQTNFWITSSLIMDTLLAVLPL
ncbi:unnamed protein product [Ilex paraguariensis]|uniref:HECT-type E3 ubiquitin transferase n=1 Tax=Ilex paraguariensis TaxID=185542 RepID=A0ABC8T6L0_9AQUA